MICLKIRTFVVSATTHILKRLILSPLWFAWKFVPLWYQQQRDSFKKVLIICCDLLENSYLCGISNNLPVFWYIFWTVVICLKIRTFVVSATTDDVDNNSTTMLWFAWKFVPLWYQQQPSKAGKISEHGCDLLENSYLCGISNNYVSNDIPRGLVVICLKIRTFVVSATTSHIKLWVVSRCDLLENSYLCGISNNRWIFYLLRCRVVICLKIRTFVVSATTWQRGFFCIG